LAVAFLGGLKRLLRSGEHLVLEDGHAVCGGSEALVGIGKRREYADVCGTACVLGLGKAGARLAYPALVAVKEEQWERHADYKRGLFRVLEVAHPPADGEVGNCLAPGDRDFRPAGLHLYRPAGNIWVFLHQGFKCFCGGDRREGMQGAA
jgi:hypothetical protein